VAKMVEASPPAVPTEPCPPYRRTGVTRKKAAAGVGRSTPVPQAIPRRGDGGPTPLSFAPQRRWFLDRLEPNSPVLHIAAAVRIQGRLDQGALRCALAAIVARHETLRTTFATQDGQAVQAPRAGPGALERRGLRGPPRTRLHSRVAAGPDRGGPAPLRPDPRPDGAGATHRPAAPGRADLPGNSPDAHPPPVAPDQTRCTEPHQGGAWA